MRLIDSRSVGFAAACLLALAAPLRATAPLDSPITITTTSLPIGIIAQPYSQGIALSGATPPLQWSIVSGTLPTGILLLPTGVLAGIPLAAGSSSFTIGVQDSLGFTANASLTLVVAAPVSITTTSLPVGERGAAYSQTLAASGASGTYTWSLATGSLPAGLTLSPGGVIAGTPTSTGNSNFSVQVGSAGTSDTQPLNIMVASAIGITTTSLPSTVVGSTYQQNLNSNGGTGGNSWTVSTGALPAGLTLSPGGAISGTPTTAGTANFTAQVTDSAGGKATANLSIVVGAALSVSTSSLPGAIVGTPYQQNLTASGGTGGYSWKVISGALPAGVNLNPAGAFNGAPSSAGTASFTVQVTDNSSAKATADLSIVVTAALSVVTSSLPSAVAGTAYQQTLTASGGAGGYTWTMTNGALPVGLTLSAAGAISGTPSAAAPTPNFTVQVTDSNSAKATAKLSIAVSPALSVGTSSLPGGVVGTAYQQTLTAAGGTGGYSWSVATGSLPAGLTLSAAGAISGTPSSAGTATFTVQVTDSSSAKATANLSIVVAPALSIGTTSLPGGVVGTAYQQTLTASGGTGGYSWSVATGALPAGLKLSAAGAISGTPSAAGTANFTVQVADSSSAKVTANLSIVVIAALTVSTATLPGGIVGTAYQQTLAATGGTGGYSWSVATGSLPAGLTLSAAGAITGTPSAAGTATFVVQVSDSSSAKATANLSIVVGAALTVSTSSLSPGVVGVAYQQNLTAAGGTGGYSWSVATGALPAGLKLSAAGAISGTPSATGTATFTVQVTDSSSAKATGNLSIVVGAGLTVSTSSLPAAVVGAAYQQTLTAIGGTGGYSWTVSTGALPTGLTLSAAGAIAGSPSSAGTANFTVQVTDSSSAKATASLSIVVGAALTIGTSSLPGGVVGVAYQQTLTAAGGTGGYGWSVTTGALPAGLTLSAAGIVSGTPSSAGTANFTVQVTDSSSAKATASLSIVVVAGLTVSTTSLPAAIVGTAYRQTLTAAGGTGGYAWAVTSGSLPAGLALSAAGALSGTPSSAGTANFTVQVTDSSSAKASANLSIVVGGALTVVTLALPAAVVGTPYLQTLTAGGGSGGYTWSVTTGALPGGLTLSAAGVVSGTPSIVGTANFTAQVTDSSSAKATANLSISVSAALNISTTSIPPGIVGTAYQATLIASGGTGVYSWTVTAGTPPAGLTLSTAGILSGTPSAAGTANFTVQVEDSSSAKSSAPLSLAITSALSVVTASGIAAGAVSVPYSQTFTAQGGAPPYTWQISGTLPAGLSLAAATGILSGTPTQSGTFPIAVNVSDSAGKQASANYSLVIAAGLTIATPPGLPAATVGVAYTTTLQAIGGASPYQWVVTAGSLPAGLSFNGQGSIGGTPTSSGNFTITVEVTDAQSNKASKQFTLAVVGAITITSTSLPGGATQSQYSQTLTATGGTPPYSWSVTVGSLPNGLSLQPATGILSGTPVATGTFNFTVTVTDANSATATQQFSIAVGQGVGITTASSLPGATAGASYTATLAATGGTAPYTWAIAQGALPAGLTLDASAGTITGTPTTPGTFNFTVRATDAASVAGTAVMTIVVAAPSTLPSLSIGGFSGAMAPLQQPALHVTFAQPYPIAVSGTLGLTFKPSGPNGIDDPSIQFSTGGRTATFTIPANALQATFTAPQLAVQTGSVQGAITVSVVSLQSNGASLPIPSGLSQTVQIAAAPPSISSISVVKTAGGIEVQITGAADTRELTQVTVGFQPSSGTTVQTQQLTVQLNTAAATWFSSATAAAYGGQFSLSLPFTFTGSVSLSSVSAILASSAGNSPAASANF